MGVSSFIRRYVWPSIQAFVGSMMVIGGYVSDAVGIVNLGIPVGWYQAIGAALIIFAVFAFMYRWDKQFSETTSTNESSVPARPHAAEAQHSFADEQFESDLRKFVLSRLHGAMTGFFDVFGEMANRHSGELQQDKVAVAEWDAGMQLMNIADDRSVRKPFEALKKKTEQHPFDAVEIQKLTVNLLAEYNAVKQVAANFMKTMGVTPNGENLGVWIAAERNCLDALKDLRASSVAIPELRGCSDHFLSNKVF